MLLLSHRYFWEETHGALVRHQPEANGSCLQHYGRMYCDTQFMGIRRLTEHKGRQEPASLVNLLRTMPDRRSVLTRQRWIDSKPSFPQGLNPPRDETDPPDAGRTFDREYADSDGLVRLELIEEDLALLTEVRGTIKDLADKALARLDHDFDSKQLPDMAYHDIGLPIDKVDVAGGRWVYLMLGRLRSWEPPFYVVWKEPLRVPVFRD
jgi:hypothetical protein